MKSECMRRGFYLRLLAVENLNMDEFYQSLFFTYNLISSSMPEFAVGT